MYSVPLVARAWTEAVTGSGARRRRGIGTPWRFLEMKKKGEGFGFYMVVINRPWTPRRRV
jgi:hypothetical protein